MPSLISRCETIKDAWVKLEDVQPIDDCRNVIVSLQRLKQQWVSLIRLPVNIGVMLEPTDSVDDLLPFLDRLRIVVLQFETFADGRAFSQARLLRDRYSYRGDIRAVGDVLCDQFCFMQRNGFNQFELAAGEDIDLAFRTFSEISLTYRTEVKNLRSNSGEISSRRIVDSIRQPQTGAHVD